jgi:hypothetical protein
MKTISTALVVAATLAATLAACTSKQSPAPTAPTTPPAPVVSIVRLELNGPGTVYIGQPAQFTVTAHQSDGTARDVTREAAWRSFNSNLLTMTTPGLFTGRSAGQTGVSVMLSGRGATISEVIVVPPGTFRLIGFVRDEGVPVEAVVRIEDEALGRTEWQTQGSRYIVFGVAGATRVTVVKSGYELETKSQVLTTHQRIDFDLVLTRPRTDVSGRYTLTITAAPDCSTLPPDLLSRSYAAVVAQSGPTTTVTLEGAQFASSGNRTYNRFTGIHEVDRVTFRLILPYNYYSEFQYPDVFEVLAPDNYYTFHGTAVAFLGPATLSGSLDGFIGTYSGPTIRGTGGCRSANHRFVLARRTT